MKFNTQQNEFYFISDNNGIVTLKSGKFCWKKVGDVKIALFYDFQKRVRVPDPNVCLADFVNLVRENQDKIYLRDKTYYCIVNNFFVGKNSIQELYNYMLEKGDIKIDSWFDSSMIEN